MNKTAKELFDAVKACNDRGELSGNPCRRTKAPCYGYVQGYRTLDLKAWHSLIASCAIVSVPLTDIGAGYATAESLLPGTPLATRLNGPLCKEQAKLEALIHQHQAKLRTIGKILGNRQS